MNDQTETPTQDTPGGSAAVLVPTPDEGTPPPAPPEHSFQVTHYVRPPGDRASWAQHASGELSADDARTFIDVRDPAMRGRGQPGDEGQPSAGAAGGSGGR